MKVAVTGHRPNKLGGYGNTYKVNKFAEQILEQNTLNISMIFTGMAQGWDQAIAQACRTLKIPFTACVPFTGQELRWSITDQIYYNNLLRDATEIITVSTGQYSARKMQRRNIYMVNNAEAVLALWNGTKGGTANCVEYAKQVNTPVINFWGKWESFQ